MNINQGNAAQQLELTGIQLTGYQQKRYIVLGEESAVNGIVKEMELSAGIRALQYCHSLQDLDLAELDPRVTILVTSPNVADSDKSALEAAMTKGLTVEYLPVMVEKHLKRIPEKVFNLFNGYYDVIYSSKRNLKLIRILDIGFASVLLLLSLPLLSFAGLYILFKDGRPVFYKQSRRGFMGRHYMLYKLRTYDDVTNEEGETETISTRSGYLLRKFRLNELPQLVNVISGEMSMVGPRPDIESVYQQNMEAIRSYFTRFIITPGITGHAQVYYKYCYTVDDFRQRQEYDLYYIKNQTIGLYFVTLLKTVKTILLGKGK